MNKKWEVKIINQDLTKRDFMIQTKETRELEKTQRILDQTNESLTTANEVISQLQRQLAARQEVEEVLGRRAGLFERENQRLTHLLEVINLASRS